VDTRDGRIRAYPFDVATGELGPLHVLVEAGVLPGRPDGMTVDAEGFLWSARYAGGGIARIDPDGKVERFVRLPVSQPSSVMFGGRDLDVLYVTTSRQKLSDEALAKEPLAGALLAVRVDVKGLPERSFAE
jgi:sugar lactone lactonase YvrE